MALHPNKLSLIECPYDSSHMISPLRMPYHLFKCRKNFPFMEMVVCPFNGYHEVQKPELKYHMLNCPDKDIIERDICFSVMKEALKNSDVKVLKGYTELPPSRDLLPQETEEDWDSERNFESFSAFATDGLRNYRHRERRDLKPSRLPMTPAAAACMSAPVCSTRIEENPVFHNPSLALVGVGRARPLTGCAMEPASSEPQMAGLMNRSLSTTSSRFPLYLVGGRGRGLAGLKISD